MMKQIIYYFNQLPSYMGEGIVQIIVTIFCGVVLGWLTSRFFSRRNEVIRVEGLLMEKKLPVYEGIIKRIGKMNNMCMIPREQVNVALATLQECGLEIEETSGINQICKMFDNPDEFAKLYLEFDKYCVDNKIYFDDITNYPILFFQNYLAFVHRFGVMFEDALGSFGQEKDSTEAKKFKRGLYQSLAILFKDEFFEQTQVVENAIRTFYNHPTLSHRSDPNYNYEFFSAENGYLMQRMNKTIVGKEENRPKITELVTIYAAMAMARNKM